MIWLWVSITTAISFVALFAWYRAYNAEHKRVSLAIEVMSLRSDFATASADVTRLKRTLEIKEQELEKAYEELDAHADPVVAGGRLRDLLRRAM